VYEKETFINSHIPNHMQRRYNPETRVPRVLQPPHPWGTHYISGVNSTLACILLCRLAICFTKRRFGTHTSNPVSRRLAPWYSRCARRLGCGLVTGLYQEFHRRGLELRLDKTCLKTCWTRDKTCLSSTGGMVLSLHMGEMHVMPSEYVF